MGTEAKDVDDVLTCTQCKQSFYVEPPTAQSTGDEANELSTSNDLTISEIYLRSVRAYTLRSNSVIEGNDSSSAAVPVHVHMYLLSRLRQLVDEQTACVAAEAGNAGALNASAACSNALSDTSNRIRDMATQQPLCLECASRVSEFLKEEVEFLSHETAMLQAAISDDGSDVLTGLEATPVDGIDSPVSIPRSGHSESSCEIQELRREETRLKEEIALLEAEEVELEKQLDDTRADAQEVAAQEDQYWQEFNDYQQQVQLFQEERDGLKQRIVVASSLLSKLKRTNVLNDAFHIWFDGHFGIINHLRMGRLPAHPVEWKEINAAWGLCALLLVSIARKLKFEFKSYRIIPRGSLSVIEIDNSRNTCELYGGVSSFFRSSKFDKGTQHFLECVRQLEYFIKEHDSGFRPPYEIERDTIGTIPMRQSGDDKWTCAQKYLLTNLKTILLWTSRHA